MSETTVKKQNRLQAWMSSFKAMSAADKRRTVNSLLVNNAMYIIIALVVIFIAIRVPAYRSVNSIVNIVNLTAAKLPIALGIAGCIVLTGTDISAGRMVGLAAVIVASMSITANKIFPGLEPLPIIIPLLAAIAACAMIGFINGFSVAKFDLHPFIVTLATQLITYGIILIYLKMGTNNGQTLSGFDPQYRDLVTGTLFTIAGVRVPMYVLYSLILVGLMWVIWNKTTFGKNMFAVGSNKEAAEVSGVNVPDPGGADVGDLEQDHLRQEHVRSGFQQGSRRGLRCQCAPHDHPGVRSCGCDVCPDGIHRRCACGICQRQYRPELRV